MRILRDRHERQFSYLRLSLTDACNFRCLYCLPNGYSKRAVTGDRYDDTVLNVTEIENLVRGFAEIGFKKIRLTGGEPTLRPDIIEIVEKVASIPGIKIVALTTNGYRLDKLAEPLHRAGLNAINISLDSLNPKHFEEITGSRNFERVYEGMHRALNVGIEKVKINVVLLKSFVEKDLHDFFELVRETPISVRFIELMETGENTEFFRSEHFSGDEFRTHIQNLGWTELTRSALDGPACEFFHSNYSGRIGVIAPYSKDFCVNCNRLRVSSRGKMKLCLFGDGEISLRRFLQSPDQREDLVQLVQEIIGEKAPSHRLHEGIYGSTQNLSGIGG